MIFRTLLFLLISVSLYAQDSYKIAVLFWSMNIEGQVAMREGLEKEATLINSKKGKKIELIRYIAGDGEDGTERQILQFHEAIDSKVDAIVVQPTDNAALAEPLIRANREKIPVFAYDQYISSGEMESFITSDNYQAGYLNGEYVAHHIKDHDKRNEVLKIVLVEYPFVSSTISRVEGFLDALEDYRVAYKIVARYEAVEPLAGKKVAKKLLETFPKKGSVDLVFAVNDAGGLAVARELIDAKRDEIHFATIDGDPASVELIREKSIIHIDSAQFCGAMGAVALQTAYDHLNGKKVYKEILIPVFPVTKDTIDRYTGWLGDIADDFEKPWQSKTPIWSGKIIQRD